MCIAPPKLVKQHLIVNYDLYNILLPLEPVYGIHVLNEGNRIEFLLASKWGSSMIDSRFSVGSSAGLILMPENPQIPRFRQIRGS
jgi:hypothetical protein